MTKTTTTTTPDEAGADELARQDAIAAEIEKVIRSAFDLGDAAQKLRSAFPAMSQGERLAEIKRVMAKILEERERPNPRRTAIEKMARQHAGESHREEK